MTTIIPVKRETPLMAHWRIINAILAAAGEREATFGEMRNHNTENFGERHYSAHPMRTAYLIWSDRRP